VAAARKHFHGMGWSYRSAAPHLGVSYQHLCQVLTGDRQSRRLIAAVLQLPTR
jgi:lambda repressor-like predicted transcriptional regulator